MQSRTRRSPSLKRPLLLLVLLLLALSGPVPGEEGMWTFDNPPLQQLQEKYGFIPSSDWLDHVRLSSVRLNDGGSGSFVSPHGLVLTNHHVASGQLQKVSSAGKDYLKEGFLARTRGEEIRCPDLEMNVLVSLEDVTRRVQGAVKEGMSPMDALKARQAEAAKIEKESLDATGLRAEVVSLYQGGEYWLYRYKKYTDLRIVFAPESGIAYFGGDPDNFTYPRYALDMALFRAYEDGKPVESRDYLKWNSRGAADGDLVFISGNPGSTSRGDTVAQIETQRDFLLPLYEEILKRMEKVLRSYAAGGAEEERQATERILGVTNALKSISGMRAGLSDPRILEGKRAEEAQFRERVRSGAAGVGKIGDPWKEIERAEKKYRRMVKPLLYRGLSDYDLPGLALTLVQYAAEAKKPDAVRLEGFHDSQLESLRFALFSPAPVYPALEEVLLADSLKASLEALGPEDPFVRAMLGGRSPGEVAREAIRGTRMAEPEFRMSLAEGGWKAVADSADPLIALARKADPVARDLDRWMEENVESVEIPAGERIGAARFALHGKSAYPDANFTPRLSYGTVKGYPMNGTQAPPWTTLYGLLDRAHGFGMKEPYSLPKRLLERKGRLDLSTPLNFVTTNDSVGGNSGSPVIDRQGDLVGLIFDGNIESLSGDYVYDPGTNRSVAVHPAAMIHLLRNLYDAGPLADELEGKTPPARKRP
jgi:hypothetical protein